MVLQRSRANNTGVYGELLTDEGSHVCYTLEHAYSDGFGGWMPKVAPGTYECVRHAPNRLPYETFELLEVPDFQGHSVSGILLHMGNYDKDSEGCILLGANVENSMIINSKIAFQAFMSLLKGQDRFTLTVLNK